MELKKTNNIEHGLLTTLINNVPESKRFQNMDPARKEIAEKKMKRDNRLVKGRYINYRDRDRGYLYKPYCKYAGDPMLVFKFLHDHVYEVPQGLVDEVNDPRKRLPRRSEVLDVNNQLTDREGVPERIHEFVPVNF